jgi:hypothetical protein
LAEIVREDGIVFPPCFPDFIGRLVVRTIGSFGPRRNWIGTGVAARSRVVCVDTNC